MANSLPPGPRYPSPIQAVGFWKRPLAYLERLRSRYGKRFTVPPEVLHPGEGARILEPIVGANSVILLDGDAHMSQRKLMLPAFHGERMERLTDLVTEVTEREVESWGRERELELHPKMQRLTLEASTPASGSTRSAAASRRSPPTVTTRSPCSGRRASGWSGCSTSAARSPASSTCARRSTPGCSS